MMKKSAKVIVAIFLMVFAAIPAVAQSYENESETVPLGSELHRSNPEKVRRLARRLIAPKGDWQVGLSVMYADFNAANSDYMLLLDGLDAHASMFKIAPEASIAVADNHALGIKFNYTRLAGGLDAATLDLLGNLSLGVGGLNALSNSMGGSIYQRTFVGIDKQGRFGIFWDYILGYTKSKTQLSLSADSSSHVMKNKYYFAFAPGLIYYPMNNVSIHAGISILDISYSETKAFNNDTFVGIREGWKANASLNLLNLSFGLAIHL
jgi:opacity protein-like surface antigen